MWGLRRPGVVGPRGMERRWYHQPIRRSWTWLWTTGAMLSPRLRLKARKIVHLVQTKDPKGAQAVKILNDRVLAGGPEASTAQTLLDMVRRMAGI